MRGLGKIRRDNAQWEKSRLYHVFESEAKEKYDETKLFGHLLGFLGTEYSADEVVNFYGYFENSLQPISVKNSGPAERIGGACVYCHREFVWARYL